MTRRVVVVTTDGTEISMDAVSRTTEALVSEVTKTLTAPGSVLTLHAQHEVTLIPVRAIRHVRIEEEQ